LPNGEARIDEDREVVVSRRGCEPCLVSGRRERASPLPEHTKEVKTWLAGDGPADDDELLHQDSTPIKRSSNGRVLPRGLVDERGHFLVLG